MQSFLALCNIRISLSKQGFLLSSDVTSVSTNAKPTMAGKTKRKWRWSSKSLFASTASKKAVKLDHSMLDNHDGVAEYNVTKEVSVDGCSTEDFEHRSGVAAKMRRNGSKLLSVVGIQRGNWPPLLVMHTSLMDNR